LLVEFHLFVALLIILDFVSIFLRQEAEFKFPIPFFSKVPDF